MGYRRGAVFVANWREHSRALDRNEIARIIFLAEAMERATKQPGRRNGCLGYVGLVILRALIFRFMNRKTGLCCPSYGALQRATGLCRQSISTGLQRLETTGIVRIVRRLCRQRVGNVVATTMATSLYSFWQPICSVFGPESTGKGATKLNRPPRTFPVKRGGPMGLGELLILGMKRYNVT